eukprot:Gregarina_sp_Pseudo_9__4458@NODE_4617_length_396_cov_11_042017_g4281_i0_p2_GENE_NODE_4617_length_396_cov_11_042017_g4281_i0NODE_4617_length_396_cov_11_042017_g4281_i0_p2_ORF_typecomplete_len115_score17_30SecE/PF00584_20/1_1e08NPR1_like_C/PF12313_8/0_18_NODE_4617_length_396_cov_11_042017_g4281_i04348
MKSKRADAQFEENLKLLTQHAATTGQVESTPVIEHELVKQLRTRYSTLQQTTLDWLQEGERFFRRCTKPSPREFKSMLIFHVSGFVVLALLGVATKLLFKIFSSILMLPKPGTF